MVYNILLTFTSNAILHSNSYINRYYQINVFECDENDDFTDTQKYRTVIWISDTLKSYTRCVNSLNIFSVIE